MRFGPAMLFDTDPDAGGSGGQTGGGEKPLTFTQAQLDVLFAERSNRARDAAVKELLDKSGAKSVEELLATLSDGKKLLDGQKSEAERLQAQLQAIQEKLTAAEAAKAEALATASERLLRAAVLAEATRRGFLPEAVQDVWGLVERSKIKEKDGEFEGVKEAVEAVAKARPFWLSAAAPKGTPITRQAQQPAGENQPPQVRALPTVTRF